ncbi:ATP synthase subunit I [Melghirimyces algeriensis]|uniref:ATP synthase I chain n=1 Tax=Melghirimyces algeriensis TaxID=910412 RepID=A0A521D6D7_9BACL|nr:ATP synthase subunit I [Melghirimyces algeriensis]SMO67239.1 ATP synthase I chain [Melghirimyces algeriensis]
MDFQPYRESLGIRRHRVLIFTASVLALIFLMWLIFPAKSFFAGLFLGGLVSLYNVLHISRKLRLAGEAVLSGAKTRGLGMANRFLALVLPLILGIRFPEQVNVLSIFLGLPIGYVTAIVVELSCIKTDPSIPQKKGVNEWNGVDTED